MTLEQLAEDILDTVLDRYRNHRKELAVRLYLQGWSKAQIAKKLKLSAAWVGEVINQRIQGKGK